MTAIVVEDGTAYSSNDSPLVRPNSYVTEQEAIDAWTLRNDLEAAEAESEAICAALVYAFDYITQEFRMRWRGSKVRAFQYADWPRSGVAIPDFFDPYYRNVNVPFEFRHTLFWAPNIIPPEIKDAQILLARQSLVDSTTTQTLQGPLGRTTKRERLGALEVEYFGAEGGGDRQTTYYWDAVQRLRPYLRSKTGGMVVRS